MYIYIYISRFRKILLGEVISNRSRKDRSISSFRKERKKRSGSKKFRNKLELFETLELGANSKVRNDVLMEKSSMYGSQMAQLPSDPEQSRKVYRRSR